MANFEPLGVEAVVKGLAAFENNLDSMVDSIDEVGSKIEDMSSEITQAINTSINNLGTEMAETATQTKTFGEKIKGIVNVAANVTTALVSVGKVIFDIGKAAFDAAVKVAKFVFEVGKSAVESAISFESAFAGVIKTTDGLVDSQGNLTDIGTELQLGFRDLAKEIPASVEELLALGEVGGQLGIARGDLLEFTATVAAMGEATNISADEAGVAFAQLANIMGTEGSDAFSRMGSAVVELGNNFATNEKDIVNFASRIAGAGAVAGLTEADVFAIGAAMSSVGVKAEAGGTAVQKVLLAMNQSVATGSDQMEIFAGVAGVSAEDFAELWEKDAGAAFEGFVSGLGDMGDDALLVLQELGLQDQRLISSFLSLSGAGELLQETMDLSSSAFEENTALQKEAAQRYATTESQLELMKNTLKDIGIEVGLALLPVLQDLLVQVRPFIEEFGGWLANVLPGIISQAAEWFQTVLIPIFAEVWEWLANNIPTAIQEGSAFWQDTLLPAIQAVGDWITNVLVPIMGEIWTWLQTNIPKAIAFLSSQWQETFLPVLAALGELWATGIQPILAALVEWLGEVLPPIIQTLAAFWEETLLPAINAVWQFVAESVIPMFTELLVWLQDNIPPALEALAAWWQETLKPAIEAVWAFIVENLFPLFQAVSEFITAVFNKALEALALIWEESIQPALETVWKFIQDKVIPIIEDLVEAIEKTLGPVLDALKKFLDENLTPAFETVKTVIGKVAEFIGDLADAINDIDVTKLLPFLGKSPSPLEKGLRGIGAAMQQLNQVQLPQFSQGMAMAGVAAAPMVMQSSSNISVQVGPNTISSQIDQAVFEERVVKVVRDNIG